MTADDGGVVTSPATVETGPDGTTTSALIDQTLTRPGHFTVTLAVCRGDACTRTSFAVDVPALNAPPAVDVSLSSSDVPAQPTSTVLAIATPVRPGERPGHARLRVDAQRRADPRPDGGARSPSTASPSPATSSR